MSRSERYCQHSAGTRSPLGDLAALSRKLRKVSSATDLEAVSRGQGRTVSCFLRGSMPPYPRHVKQGTLRVAAGDVSWRPTWGLRRPTYAIHEKVRAVHFRAPGRAEWNVKKGGTAFGVITIPQFTVIVASTDRGVLEFTVPVIDADLVTTVLRSEPRAVN